MAYGYRNRETHADRAWKMVDEAIRLEIQEVPADKIILGLPAYGTVYSETPKGAKGFDAGGKRSGPDGVERTHSLSSRASTPHGLT